MPIYRSRPRILVSVKIGNGLYLAYHRQYIPAYRCLVTLLGTATTIGNSPFHTIVMTPFKSAPSTYTRSLNYDAPRFSTW